MRKTLHVGNLPSSTTDSDVHDVFAKFGTVSGVLVAIDHNTGNSLGFAYVEMENGGERAVEALHQSELQGHSLAVKESERTFIEAMRLEAEKWGPELQ